MGGRSPCLALDRGVEVIVLTQGVCRPAPPRRSRIVACERLRTPFSRPKITLQMFTQLMYSDALGIFSALIRTVILRPTRTIWYRVGRCLTHPCLHRSARHPTNGPELLSPIYCTITGRCILWATGGSGSGAPHPALQRRPDARLSHPSDTGISAAITIYAHI